MCLMQYQAPTGNVQLRQEKDIDGFFFDIDGKQDSAREMAINIHNFDEDFDDDFDGSVNGDTDMNTVTMIVMVVETMTKTMMDRQFKTARCT